MRARTKLIIGTVLLLACGVAALTLPLPSPAEMRAWALGAGWLGPALLLLAYSVLAAAPIPRTAFNLAAGLLLGNAVGILVAILGTAAAGALGFGIARLLGREFVRDHLRHGSVRAVNDRLAGGGALAVTSLRLIPVIPFAPLSYCCGVLSVRLRPYLAGTVLGSLPGTVAVVVLGDALTGNTPPALLACYAVFGLLGAAGLIRVVRRGRAEALPGSTQEPATLDAVREPSVRAR